MTVFFTADTHFGHGGALGLYRRPFESVAAMDRGLVERWNALIGPADVVWHLGDFAVRPRPARVDQLLGMLAGEKHLIVGNNDGEATLRAPGWASVRCYAETVVDDVLVVLCHYPFRTWNRQPKGAWNLHGHSHGRLAPLARQADVGVDAVGLGPVTFAEIRARRRMPGRHGAGP